MKKLITRLMALAICVPFCLVASGLIGSTAGATLIVPYTFTQGGYIGGGIVTGTFEAINTTSTNVGTSDLIDFTLSFTGDSIVSDFSFSFGDLVGLTYTKGSGLLGDGISQSISRAQSATNQWDSRSNFAPVLGGTVTDRVTGAISTTLEGVVVLDGDPFQAPPTNGIPEPSTLAILGFALVGLGAMRRRRMDGPL